MIRHEPHPRIAAQVGVHEQPQGSARLGNRVLEPLQEWVGVAGEARQHPAAVGAAEEAAHGGHCVDGDDGLATALASPSNGGESTQRVAVANPGKAVAVIAVDRGGAIDSPGDGAHATTHRARGGLGTGADRHVGLSPVEVVEAVAHLQVQHDAAVLLTERDEDRRQERQHGLGGGHPDDAPRRRVRPCDRALKGEDLLLDALGGPQHRLADRGQSVALGRAFKERDPKRIFDRLQTTPGSAVVDAHLLGGGSQGASANDGQEEGDVVPPKCLHDCNIALPNQSYPLRMLMHTLCPTQRNAPPHHLEFTVKVDVRRAGDRGQANWGWLDSKHTFSFANYYDPQHMGFGHLRVINEDRVAGGAGFGAHPHRDMEIISYVVDGGLEHRDTTGSGGVLRHGDVQTMSAGRGVAHSEMNGSTVDPVHFLQIWLTPAKVGTEPAYGQKHFPLTQRGLVLVASPDGRSDSLPIGQDADVFRLLLDHDESVTHPLRRRRAWVQVVSGALTVAGEELQAGDGLALVDAETLDLTANADAEALIFDLR